jgi:hypothetical protein
MATELEDAKAAFDAARRQFLLKYALSAAARADLAELVALARSVQIAKDQEDVKRIFREWFEHDGMPGVEVIKRTRILSLRRRASG